MRAKPAPKPVQAPTYAALSQEAREAFASLRGSVSRLERIFSGPFTTTTAKAEIQRLTDEIRILAQKTQRLAK
jgi:hypothetical protein